MGHIVWLASYPKSGNTWMRAFLRALSKRADEEFDINGLDARIVSDRTLLDNLLGVETSDLTHEEIERLCPKAYLRLSETAAEPLPLKVHDAWRRTDQGEPVFPAEATRAVIYIIRNPLDVAVSMSHFFAWPQDKVARRMAAPDMALCNQTRELNRQTRQPMRDWSGHVASWVDESGLDVLVTRYEDMLAQPEDAFLRAARAVGREPSPGELREAIARTSFDKLAAQEGTQGFREHSGKSGRFFRSGRAGGWRNELAPELAARIAEDHTETMRRFGYEDDLNEALQHRARKA